MDIVEQTIQVEIGPRQRSYRSITIPAEEHELVWPVIPQTERVLKFSTLDNYVAKVWHVNTMFFEYEDAFPNKAEIFKNLKTGLSHALADIDVFTTYMVQDPVDPRRCNAQHDPDHAVVLKYRDYSRNSQNSSLFRQLRARQFPVVKMEDYPALMPEGLPRVVCIGAPAFTAQANFFKEGIALTMVYNHVGCDLLVMETFTRTWAKHTSRAEMGMNKLDRPFADPASTDRSRLSQGDNHATIDELPGYFVHDLRTPVPLPIQQEENSSLFCKVSKHKLDQLKQMAMETPTSRTSTVDAFTGFTWRSIVRARTNASGKPASGASKMGTGLDLRSRLRNPPARNYIGAAVAVAQIELDRQTLCGTDRACKIAAAKAIRQGIRDWNPALTDKIIGILNTQPKHEIVLPGRREIFFTSHEACTMNKQNWGLGLGLPRAVREPYYGRPPPRSEVVLHPRLLNGDAEFTLTLENSAIEMLKQDPEFREHVQIVTEVGELPINKPVRAQL